ncbi:MAG: hypothetical protein SGARI_006083 [Bacillariaceae sp.]
MVTSTVSMTANAATSTVGAIGDIGGQIGSTMMAPISGGGNAERRASQDGGTKSGGAASAMDSFFKRKPKHPPKNTKIASRELEIIKRCQEQMANREVEEAERRKQAMAEDKENIRLQKVEQAERDAVTQEVMAYREMMQDMGQEDRLAPLDTKKAAEEYDDRLAMADTMAEQEAKAKLAQRDMAKIDGDGSSQASRTSRQSEEYHERGCGCVIS